MQNKIKEIMEELDLEHEPLCSITIFEESEGERGSQFECDCIVFRVSLALTRVEKETREEEKERIWKEAGRHSTRPFADTYIVVSLDDLNKILLDTPSPSSEKLPKEEEQFKPGTRSYTEIKKIIKKIRKLEEEK